jgi:hypothetical protein
LKRAVYQSKKKSSPRKEESSVKVSSKYVDVETALRVQKAQAMLLGSKPEPE